MKIFQFTENFTTKKILKNQNILQYNTEACASIEKEIIWITHKTWEKILKKSLWESVIIFMDSILIKNISLDMFWNQDIVLLKDKDIFCIYIKSLKEDDIKNIENNHFDIYKSKRVENSFVKINSEKDYKNFISKLWIASPSKAYIYCPHQTIPAQFFYNYFAFAFTRLLIPTKISANMISSLSFIVTIIWLLIICFSLNSYLWLLFWIFLIHFWFILDCVDWWIARIKQTGSNFWGFLDASFDTVKITLFFGVVTYYEFFNIWVNIIILSLSVMSLKYLNTSLYNTAMVFTKQLEAKDFSNSNSKIKNILQKFNIKPNQITLSNDFIIIFLSIWLVFNISTIIYIFFIVYYCLQFATFYFVNFKNLKNELSQKNK